MRGREKKRTHCELELMWTTRPWLVHIFSITIPPIGARVQVVEDNVNVCDMQDVSHLC